METSCSNAVASSCSCRGQPAMALLGQNERQAVVSRAPDGQLTLHTSILGSIAKHCQSAGCHDNLRCFSLSACNFGTSNACCMMQHDKHLIASKSGNSHPNAIKSPDKARFSWPPTMKSSHCTGQCTQTTQKNRCQR